MPTPKKEIKELYVDENQTATSENIIEEEESAYTPSIPTTINEDLRDLIDDNPNKLTGCGG